MSFKSTNGHNTGMILLYTGHISYIPSRNITLSWPFIQSVLERKVFCDFAGSTVSISYY